MASWRRLSILASSAFKSLSKGGISRSLWNANGEAFRTRSTLVSSRFSRSSGLKNLNIWNKVPRRNYYVDREGYTHFERPWKPSAYSISKTTAIVLGVAVVGGGVFYYTHLEVVPYTNRNHLVLVRAQFDNEMGERTFNHLKDQYKSRILPPYHPAVLRVSSIARKVIQAAVEGIESGGAQEVELNYSYGIPHEPAIGKRVEAAAAASPRNKRLETSLHSQEEQTIEDDLWIEEARKDHKGKKVTTKHIKNFKWEIVLVDSDMVNAACLPGGKIVVFTGILKTFQRDDEIATVISHEVGHAIARHGAETVSRSIFLGFFELLLLTIVQDPSAIGIASNLLVRLPFSRMMEMEADHIGVLIMGAAGYDPRVSPSVYLKLSEIQKMPEFVQYMSTHPSGRKRAQVLLKSKAMQEAVTMYESRRSGWANAGFLL